MGYRNSVTSNVRKAFSMLKDLAVDVTLSNNRATGFDFGTAEPVIVTGAAKYIKGILIQKKQERGTSRPGAPQSGSSINMQMLFKATDVPDPSIYDTITTRELQVWKMVPPYTNDGFLVTVSVTKEI